MPSCPSYHFNRRPDTILHVKILKYRLLGIIADEIRNDEKVTKIWNSDTDKSGKATMTDRILIISPRESLPESFISNQQITWNAISKPVILNVKS